MNKRLSTTVLIALTLILPGCGTTRARTQDKLVENIELRGYKRISREEILKHVQTKAGEIFNEEQVKRDFEAVIKLDVFDRTQCKLIMEAGPRGGMVVIFELKEIPPPSQTDQKEPSVINLDELEKAGVRMAIPAGSFLMIEGALYFPAGSTVFPVPGGGASGCFDPTGGTETAAKIERAKARYVKFNATSPAK